MLVEELVCNIESSLISNKIENVEAIREECMVVYKSFKLNTKKKIATESKSNTLMGSTVPDCRTTADPGPAWTWRLKTVEQAYGVLRRDWICLASAVRICFLEDGSMGSITTAGIRPWARSLTASLWPVCSRGIAWIVW